MFVIKQPTPDVLIARYYSIIQWTIAAVAVVLVIIGPNAPVVWLTVKIPLVVFAIGWAYRSNVETCTFDKTDNTVTFSQRKLFSWQVDQMVLSEITAMVLEITPRYAFRIHLVFGESNRRPLWSALVSEFSTKEKAEQIHRFLELDTPFVIEGDQSILRTRESWLAVIIILFFAAIGYSGAYVAFQMVAQEGKLYSEGIVTEGLVFDKTTGYRNDRTYHRISYSFSAGQVTLTNMQEVDEAIWLVTQKGKPISIIYLPNDPEMNRIYDRNREKFQVYVIGGTVSAVFGVFCTVALVGGTISRLKLRAK